MQHTFVMVASSFYNDGCFDLHREMRIRPYKEHFGRYGELFPFSQMEVWADSQTSLPTGGLTVCHCRRLKRDFVFKICKDLWHSRHYLSGDAQQSHFV